MGRIVSAICILIGVAFTALCSLLAVLAFCLNERLGHKVQRFWGNAVLKLSGIHLHTEHLERIDGIRGAILAPNHESAFDIVVMASLPVDFKWVAKKQLSKVPLFGWAMRMMGCFFVDRNRAATDLNVMQQVEDGLREGKNTVIFPEGTRSRTGELLPFKKGAFRTAQNSGAPLIPIGIVGTFHIAPPKQLPRKRGHHVWVRIGTPMRIPPDQAIVDSMEEYRKRLIELRRSDG